MSKVKMYIEGIDQFSSASSIKSVLESLGETKNVKVDSASRYGCYGHNTKRRETENSGRRLGL